VLSFGELYRYTADVKQLFLTVDLLDVQRKKETPRETQARIPLLIYPKM
jgi:hypothetical protein